MIKALLYKDLKNILSYKNSKELIKIGLLTSLILIGIICLVSKIIGYYQILIMASMMCVIIYTSAFGKDENSDALNFLKGTPVGVENIVRARFILALIFLSYSLIINLISFGMVKFLDIEIYQNIRIAHIVVVHLVMLSYCTILSLLIYKFGSAKAVIIVLAGIASLVGLIIALGVIMKVKEEQVELLISSLNIPLTISIISIVLIFINYKLSVKVVRNS